MEVEIEDFVAKKKVPRKRLETPIKCSECDREFYYKSYLQVIYIIVCGNKFVQYFTLLLVPFQRCSRYKILDLSSMWQTIQKLQAS